MQLHCSLSFPLRLWAILHRPDRRCQGARIPPLSFSSLFVLGWDRLAEAQNLSPGDQRRHHGVEQIITASKLRPLCRAGHEPVTFKAADRSSRSTASVNVAPSRYAGWGFVLALKGSSPARRRSLAVMGSGRPGASAPVQGALGRGALTLGRPRQSGLGVKDDIDPDKMAGVRDETTLSCFPPGLPPALGPWSLLPSGS